MAIPTPLNANNYKKYTEPKQTENAENWDNKKYWLKKHRKSQSFTCSIMKALVNKIKDEKRTERSKNLERECNDESFNNSRIGIHIIDAKIIACDVFWQDGFYKRNNKVSNKKKDEIFNECKSFYNLYSQDSNHETGLNQFYKMFYIYKLTTKQVNYELENWQYKYEKCKHLYEYKKCMGWMYE